MSLNSDKLKCFSANGALTAEATTLQPTESRAASPTLSLEMAMRGSDGYDWKNKIAVQLQPKELALLASVLLGYMPSIKIERPTKGIEVKRQDNSIYMRATAGRGNLVNMQIDIGDAYRLTTFTLEQLQKQSFVSDGGLILASLRGVSALYKA